MSRILAYTSPARGHLYPLTPILDELRERGHEVIVRTLESEVPLMRARGFKAEPISPKVAAIEPRDWQAPNPRKGLQRSVQTFTGRAEFDAADLSNAIRNEQPDAVVVDINAWGAMAAAEKWGGAWASFCPYPLALRSIGVPPFGPGWAPAKGITGRLRDTVLRPVVMGVLARAMLPPLNDLRAGLGLAPLQRSDSIFSCPPLLIYMTSEPFEYTRPEWPDNIVLVGPCDWEPPGAMPDWFDAIQDPIILVTTSSEFQNDGLLVRTALEAFADQPVHVIATLPSGQPGEYSVPANAHVERYVPHGLVLARTSCAVTHGGMGATQKALAHSVPVCAVPFGRDQFEVARRVESAGAGTRLPARRLTPERLRTRVAEATAMVEGARRVAAGYVKAGGAPAAADAIERRLLS